MRSSKSSNKTFSGRYKPISKFHQWVIHIGIESLASPERERAISINQFLLLALEITLAFQLYYLLFDPVKMMPVILVHAVAAGIYLSAFYANTKGNFLIAACMALAGPLLFQVPVVCFLISAESGMHIFLLAGGLFTFLVFTDQQKIYRLIFIAVSLVLFIVIDRYFTRDLAMIKLSAELLTSMVYLNAIGTSVMIYLLSSLSYRMITEQGNQIKIQAQSLEMLAHTDSLTQLPNRRQIVSATKTDAHGKSIFKGVLAIADIDNFKKFNDQYGHDCGDEILRSIAFNMSTLIRSKDMVARWGGEEFIFLISGLDMAEAEPMLQRLRESIEQTPITHLGLNHSITVSIGATQMGGHNNFKEAFKRADQALYQCKQNGKNCFLSS
ncbi:MAG: GGDEF domain-containing protein [Pseudomonadales bacterium]|nr:GGDEF domain-containing protein [Pseudomonadales bacterium]